MEKLEKVEQKIVQQKQKNKPLKGFFCPISDQIMVEPMTCDTDENDKGEDTYEREEIKKWLVNNDTNPITNVKLKSKTLKPNKTMEKLIREFLQENPEYYENGEVYLPTSWIQQLVDAIKHDQLNAVNDWLAKDPRLLTMPLDELKTAFHLSCETSLELSDFLLKRLVAKEKLDEITTLMQPLRFRPIYLNALLLKEEDEKTIDLLLKLVPDINAVDPKTGNTLLKESINNHRWSLSLKLTTMNAKIYVENNNVHELEKEEKKLPQFEQFKQEQDLPAPRELGTNLNFIVQKKSDCLCIEPLPDEKVAIGRMNGKIEILDQKNAKRLIVPESLTGHSGPVTCLLYIPENQILVSGSSDNTIRIWDLNSFRYGCIKTLQQHTGPVIHLKRVFNEYFASCSADNTIIIWDTNGKCMQVLGREHGHTEPVLRVEPLSNNYLISCSVDKTLKVWNEWGECVQTLGGEHGHTGPVSCVVEVNNNNSNNNDLIVASGSTDHTIKLWDTHSGACITTLNGHTDSVNCLLSWSPNTLITGSADKTIRVWNITTSYCTYILSGHNGPILSLQQLVGGELMSNDEYGVKTWSGPDYKEQVSPKKLFYHQ